MYINCLITNANILTKQQSLNFLLDSHEYYMIAISIYTLVLNGIQYAEKPSYIPAYRQMGLSMQQHGSATAKWLFFSSPESVIVLLSFLSVKIQNDLFAMSKGLNISDSRYLVLL